MCRLMAKPFCHFDSTPRYDYGVLGNFIRACLGDLNFSLGKELVDVFAGDIALVFSARNLINEVLLREERIDGGALFLGALLPGYNHNEAVSVWNCGCLEPILMKGGVCII